MMKTIAILLFLLILFSCTTNNHTSNADVVRDTVIINKKEIDTVYIKSNIHNNKETAAYFILERLPNWFVETDILNGLKIKNQIEIDNRMNPLYLEADFNGDGDLDIVIPIKNIDSQKVGFAIIHGKTNKSIL